MAAAASTIIKSAILTVLSIGRKLGKVDRATNQKGVKN